MKVFVTGATGFVGSAVTQEFIAHGHSVLGLSRSDDGAAKLVALGAGVRRGTLEDHAGLHEAASQCDAVIHCGFSHDFSKFAETCENDRKVIATFADAYTGTQRPIVVTSGAALLRGAEVSEDMPVPAGSPNPRVATEQAAEAAVSQGADVRVVRLPIVHGENDPGFLRLLITLARQKGFAAYMGTGENCWPTVHLLDTAPLYRLVLERGETRKRYHPVAEAGVAFRDIAEAIGKRLDLPVRSLEAEEAQAYFTWFFHFAGLDCKASSAITRKALDWEPKQEGVLADLSASPTYFLP
ncbi:MAG: SDR family oxidoreductase [Armatimonas sp.]